MREWDDDWPLTEPLADAIFQRALPEETRDRQLD